MRKLIGAAAVAFTIFAVATRPAEAAAIAKLGVAGLWSAANALLDALVGLAH
jgi:hypothetical protein